MPSSLSTSDCPRMASGVCLPHLISRLSADARIREYADSKDKAAQHHLESLRLDDANTLRPFA